MLPELRYPGRAKQLSYNPRSDLAGTKFAVAKNHVQSWPVVAPNGTRYVLKVRITQEPVEAEIEGVSLDIMHAGDVRDVSALVGLWLIAKGYADVEMRHAPRDGTDVSDLTRPPFSPLALRRGSES